MTVIHATAARLTRLDADGRPVGAPIVLTGLTVDMQYDDPEPAGLLEAWRPLAAMGWACTVRKVPRSLVCLLMGWRTPSPLLARHRRRRHK